MCDFKRVDSGFRFESGSISVTAAPVTRSPRAAAVRAALQQGGSSPHRHALHRAAAAAPSSSTPSLHCTSLQSCPAPSPVPQPQMQHEKQPCCSLHMQPLSVTMSSSQRRQLQRRLDLPAETSSFAARPLLLWAFQSSQWQLQAVFGRRPSLLRISVAQSRAFGCHLGAEQRQSCSLQPFTAGAVCHSCRHTLCLISIYGSASHPSFSPLWLQ